MNPVRLTDSADPADAANAGFSVFVEGNVSLGGDESEGTVAAGGDLTFTTNYNVAANLSNTFTTPTAPDDDQPIGLYVAGDITWPTNDSILRVLNQQFAKVVGTASYTAHVTDANGALSNYRLTGVDDTYDSTPRIEGTSNQQTIESIQTPYDGIDFTSAFTGYRAVTTEMAACAQTLEPTDAQGTALPRPIPPGDQVYLSLVEGQTNVVNLTTQELAGISLFSFGNVKPQPGTPLLVNITGSSYTGSWPNRPAWAPVTRRTCSGTSRPRPTSR